MPRVEAAARNELVEHYSGGAAERAAAIQSGAERPADEIVEDAVRWAAQLDKMFGTLLPDCWDRPVPTVGGGEHAVALLTFRSWREVEVHLADLDTGFTTTDWSQGLVDVELPKLVEGLPNRGEARKLMAWLLG